MSVLAPADVGPPAPRAPPDAAATPKRKRDQVSGDQQTDQQHRVSPFPLKTSPKFSFELPAAATAGADHDDGSNSPRSKVARKLQGLALDGGGGVGSLAALAAAQAAKGSGRPTSPSPPCRDEQDAQHGREFPVMTTSPRKRCKLPESLSGGNQLHYTTSAFAPIIDGSMRKRPSTLWATADQKEHSAAINTAGPRRSGTPPRKNASPKPRSKARSNTPPVVPSKTTAGSAGVEDRSPKGKEKDNEKASKEEDASRDGSGVVQGEDEVEDDDEVTIVDPVRAALTWHEDEITIYDPEDEDDDGTGINGIGFKPTPAVAHARVVKRRKQLAEYRKREEREARARRSRRRNGSPLKTLAGGDGAGDECGGRVAVDEDEHRRRRVRFMDIEPAVVIMTS